MKEYVSYLKLHKPAGWRHGRILTCLLAGVLLLLPILMTGCQGRHKTAENALLVYYVAKDYSKVSAREYEPVASAEDQDALLAEMVEVLGTPLEKSSDIAPLAGEMKLTGYEARSEQLILNFPTTYKKLDIIPEILYRAAIVRTLTQVPGIKTVSFLVSGDPLTDETGSPVGVMTADTFIDNAGKEISAYEQATLRLYFADPSGEQLIQANREVVYNSNISMEKLVLEELIKGPGESEELAPTLNPETQVISVSVKDGTCYVNFSDQFLKQPYAVKSDVTIYSIVNSLSELSNINKVQLSVNGETNTTYLDSVSLTTVFERNLDIIVK